MVGVMCLEKGLAAPSMGFDRHWQFRLWISRCDLKLNTVDTNNPA